MTGWLIKAMESNSNQVQTYILFLNVEVKCHVEMSEKVWYGEDWAGLRAEGPGVQGPGVNSFLAAFPTVV